MKKKNPKYLFLGDKIDLTNNSTVRSKITKQSIELVEFCAGNDYQLVIGAAPNNARELLEKGDTVKNVIITGCTAFQFVYILSRLIKNFAEVYDVSPADILKTINEYFETHNQEEG